MFASVHQNAESDMDNDSNDIPLDIAEWSRRGPFSRAHLYDLIREGELEAFKVGVKTLIYPSAMHAHIRRNARPLKLKGMKASDEGRAA